MIWRRTRAGEEKEKEKEKEKERRTQDKAREGKPVRSFAANVLPSNTVSLNRHLLLRPLSGGIVKKKDKKTQEELQEGL